ncbi:MAG: epimerase [Pseudomonadota bacterium]
MKVILFGASGMVGQGVLRECLLDDGVQSVLAVGRTALEQKHSKLSNLLHADLYNYSAIETELAGYDACFFCLGVSASGMSEAQYHRITYDLTLAAAQTLSQLNPQMTFIYVTGMGTDSSERGRSMWARVKGKTENALLRLPFKAAYMFRPGMIQPLHGIKSKTGLYRTLYAVTGPLLPLIKAVAPSSITTTEQVGRAMIKVARDGAPQAVLEAADISTY